MSELAIRTEHSQCKSASTFTTGHKKLSALFLVLLAVWVGETEKSAPEDRWCRRNRFLGVRESPRSGGLGVGVEKMPHRMTVIESRTSQAERGLRDLI